MQLQLGWLILLMVVYALAGMALGTLIMPLLARSWRDPGAASVNAWTCSAFLLGHGILANVWMLLGLIGLLSPWIIGLILLGVILLAYKNTYSLCYQFAISRWLAIKGIRAEPWPWRIVAYGCLALIVIYFLQALVVPLEPNGDAATCYMAYGKLMAAEERLLPLPKYEIFAQTGLQGEMHWAALMALGAGTQAKLFAWPFAAAAALLLVDLAGLAGLGRRGKWLALTMLFTSQAFTQHIWDGKVDLFSAAMGIAACYWLTLAGRDFKQIGLLHLAGVFLGLALLSKITLLVALVPGLMLLRVWQLSALGEAFPGWRFLAHQCFKSALIGAAWILVTHVPNLIKNAVLFGEPFAPFVLINGGSSITDQTWFSPAMTRYIVAIYPFALVFGKFPMIGGTLSVLVLMFLPLALLTPRSPDWRRSVLVQLACVGLVGVALWVIARPSVLAPRYILPPLMLLILPAAHAAAWLSERRNSSFVLSWCCFGVFLVIELVAMKYAVHINDVAHQAVCFFSNRYQECDHPSYRAIEYINDHAAKGKRVFLATHVRYWFRSDLLKQLNSEDEYAEVMEQASPMARWAAIQRGGFRYVVFDQKIFRSVGAMLGIAPESSEVGDVSHGMRVTRRYCEDGYCVFEIRESALP